MYRKHIRINCVTIASAVVLAVLAFGLLTPSALLADDVGTAFSYQGNLELLGSPVTDTCNFEFSLWSDETDTAPASQVGSTIALAPDVVDGIFTVELNLADRWALGQFHLGFAPLVDDQFRRESLPAHDLTSIFP